MQTDWADAMAEQIADRVLAKINDRFAEASIETFTEAEAAELARLERHVLKGARERGMITPVKIGKSYRYTRQQLADFVEGRSQS